MEVRGGFNGWGSPNRMPTVPGQPGKYEQVIPFNGATGDEFFYKFFLDFDSAGATSRLTGYIHSGTGATRDGMAYEHPALRGDGNNSVTLTSGGNVPVGAAFFQGINPQGLLKNATDSVTVTFKVNMGPAKKYVDAFIPATDTVKLAWEDALWRSAQVKAQGSFPQAVIMTKSPTGGDSIYQVTFKVKGPTHYNVQYRYRYVHVGGNAVDQGGGLGVQNPYITRFIQPLSPNVFPASYTFPTDIWTKNAPLPGEATAPFTTGVEQEPVFSVPATFELLQNYPNPFNPSTRIKYAISGQTHVSLKVFNLLGQEVATLVDEVQSVGSYVAKFDAVGLSTGVYFYKLEAGSFTNVKKMLLLK